MMLSAATRAGLIMFSHNVVEHVCSASQLQAEVGGMWSMCVSNGRDVM